MIIRRFPDKLTIRTELPDLAMQATWQLFSFSRTEIWFIRIPGLAGSFRIWSDGTRQTMPHVDSQAGLISFNPTKYPSLAQVREWLPEYEQLWGAVEAEGAEEAPTIEGKFKARDPAHDCNEGRMGWISTAGRAAIEAP